MKLEVNSSNIESMDYDPDSHELKVTFHGGPVYHYQDVSQEKVDAMMSESSVGKAFNSTIKNKHAFRRHR